MRTCIVGDGGRRPGIVADFAINSSMHSSYACSTYSHLQDSVLGCAHHVHSGTSCSTVRHSCGCRGSLIACMLTSLVLQQSGVLRCARVSHQPFMVCTARLLQRPKAAGLHQLPCSSGGKIDVRALHQGGAGKPLTGMVLMHGAHAFPLFCRVNMLTMSALQAAPHAGVLRSALGAESSRGSFWGRDNEFLAKSV